MSLAAALFSFTKVVLSSTPWAITIPEIPYFVGSISTVDFFLPAPSQRPCWRVISYSSETMYRSRGEKPGAMPFRRAYRQNRTSISLPLSLELNQFHALIKYRVWRPTSSAGRRRNADGTSDGGRVPVEGDLRLSIWRMQTQSATTWGQPIQAIRLFHQSNSGMRSFQREIPAGSGNVSSNSRHFP